MRSVRTWLGSQVADTLKRPPSRIWPWKSMSECLCMYMDFHGKKHRFSWMLIDNCNHWCSLILMVVHIVKTQRFDLMVVHELSLQSSWTYLSMKKICVWQSMAMNDSSGHDDETYLFRGVCTRTWFLWSITGHDVPAGHTIDGLSVLKCIWASCLVSTGSWCL